MERFEQIYAVYRPAVEAYVRRRATEGAVDDVVAETFLVCWQKLDRVPEDPLPWLYAVARKTLANHRRKLARQLTQPVDLPAREPEPMGDRLLASAFASLSESDREVLRLVAWEGLSLSEAAVVLDCTSVTCRVRYHRAKARLAGRLAAAESFRPDPEGVTR